MYTVLLTHSSLFLVVSTHYRVQLFLFTFRFITSFVFDILCKRVFSRYVRKVQLWTPWLSYAVKLFGWYLSRNDNDLLQFVNWEECVFIHSLICGALVVWKRAETSLLNLDCAMSVSGTSMTTSSSTLLLDGVRTTTICWTESRGISLMMLDAVVVVM